MRDYIRANDLEDDTDAVIRQMRDMLEGKLPARAPARRAPQRLKGTNLALTIVHSLRGEMRDIGGLDAPEELVLETKPKRRAPLITQKSVPMPEPEEAPSAEPVPVVEPMPETKEPIGPEPGPETKALLAVPLIEPEPGPEPELEPEPLEPETDFTAAEPVGSKPAPMASVEPLFEHEPQKMPGIVDIPKPKTSKLTAGDDEDDDDDGPDEDDDDEGDDDEPGPPVRMGRSKKMLLKLLKRIGSKKSVSRSRKTTRSRPKSHPAPRRRK